MWSSFCWVISLMLFSWAPPPPPGTKKLDGEDISEFDDADEGPVEVDNAFKGVLSDWKKAEPLARGLSRCYYDTPTHPQAQGRRLAISLLKCLRGGLLLGGFIELAAMLTAALPPIILRWLLVALPEPTKNAKVSTADGTLQDGRESHDARMAHSYALVAAMALTQMAAGILINASRYRLEGVGAQAKAALTYIIMDKAFLAPPSSAAIVSSQRGQESKRRAKQQIWDSGAVFNLACVEASRIEDCISGINAIWTVPASFVLAIPMLAANVDTSSLGGMVVLLLGLPIFANVALRIWGEQKALSGLCRRRAACTQQVIQGIRGIKLAGWASQTMVLNKLCGMRVMEMVTASRLWHNRAVLEAACALLPTLASMASLILYDTLHEGVPDPAKAFSSFALFLALKPHVNRAAQAAVQLQDLLVGCRAIEQWLETEEPGEMMAKSADWAVDVAQNTVVCWPATSGDGDFVLSFDTNIRVAKGQMCLDSGALDLGIGSKVAMAGQIPWLRRGTIRSNILFDQKFDEVRYWKVISASALLGDIDRMPRRDLTIIGSGGQGLSSGQAQRVSLARAMYSDADIVLIDDCLRNLDPATGKAAFEGGICSLLENKTRLFATNQAWVARRCDRVLWLDNGRARELRSLDRLEQHLPSIGTDESPQTKTTQPLPEQPLSHADAVRVAGPTTTRASVVTAPQADARVRKSFDWYLELVGCPRATSTAAGIVFCWQVTAAGLVLWLSLWTSDRLGLSGLTSVAIFAMLGFGEAILAYVLCLNITGKMLQASHGLWERSVRHVVGAPMRFFQSHSLGSIMDRLSKDVDTTDRELIEATRNATLHLARLLGGVALMLAMQINLVVVVVPGLAAVVIMMRRYAPRLKTVRSREAELRSRVNAAFSESVDGASCISVYKAETSARSLLVQRLNAWSSIRLLAAANLRWLEVRLDAIVASTIGLTGLLVVTSSASLSPSIVGLIMSQALVLPASLRQGMRFSMSALQSMVAVDRLAAYATSLPREDETERALGYRFSLEQSWPNSGEIVVRNVNVSHRQEFSREISSALQQMSFTIPGGIHIAVVGPTGGGKSTLVALLLRLLDPTMGTVTLDGIPMMDIPLHVLRSHLVAVPHDAVSFPNSTVQEAVDPKGSHSRDEIIRILSDLERVAGLHNQAPLALDEPVDEQVAQGTGRAQLVALASMILQNPRVCVLDETLGGLSVQADVEVTKMVKEALRGSTMIAVTHRMEAAMLFERVLVLDQGRIQAYGDLMDVWNKTGYDHTIRFWEALSGICSRTIQHPDSQVNRLCISPDKRFLAAAGHHTVKLYDIKSTNPNPLLTFEGHTGNITGVAFHCEGKWMVTSSEDGTVKIWETRSGQVQRSYNHGCPANDVVIHPNQGEIISCDRQGSVRVWDLAENNCSHQLIPEEDVSVSSVTVASDGSLLCAANNGGNVFVWQLLQAYDRTQLLPVTHFNAHKEYITRILLSPDVKKLATCSADHTARIWEVKDLEPAPDQEPKPFPLEATLTGHQRWVWDCAFSADSAYLVTACSDHYARLWELHSQQIIRQYNGHHRGAVCVALNDYSESAR
ncbi:rapamycin complex subunit LST8 target [Colletotrichum nymphaeae SA-01]|uniref:Rapamycin complex subunit LST8 target n=1 Tax=Colletotrichum nymphaeae SA-01 TaxID=1460502 RepID=A0A135TTX0_9PEZI|nr:rapamycin complex subunit LST8 target [Colletotrichum nymphaeae SA-01]